MQVFKTVFLSNPWFQTLTEFWFQQEVDGPLLGHGWVVEDVLLHFWWFGVKTGGVHNNHFFCLFYDFSKFILCLKHKKVNF